MASTAELVLAICQLIKGPFAIPITLKNHSADQAAEIIGGVVEECHRQGIQLVDVFVDPDLSRELGLSDGSRLPHGDKPTVRHDPELRGQVRFVSQP